MENGSGLILGIDIGSVAMAAATIKADGTVVDRFYRFHSGDIDLALAAMDTELDLSTVVAMAATGRTDSGIEERAWYDPQIAAIESVRSRYPDAGSILVVGGEKYSLARLTADGQYAGSRSNSGCAAGTGSFLDQQAGRLGLANAAALARLACSNTGEAPKVATRCAVFAKTDLIHSQQEGYPQEAIADGLCRGLARNIIDALFKGEPVQEPVVFSGGVALNDAVLKRLREQTGLQIIRDSEAPYHGAIGAALLLRAQLTQTANSDTQPNEVTGERFSPATDMQLRQHKPFHTASLLRNERKLDKSDFYPALSLTQSDYPDFSAHENYVQHAGMLHGTQGMDVEVDVYSDIKYRTRACLGIDIGSTSTKAALIDPEGAMLAGFYTRTAGKPVEAFQALLEAIEQLASQKGITLEIDGCATTGSGRAFIGGIAGADLVLDEISAHARAAVKLDPSVDTIIEIGGQDSKFTTLYDGRVTSSIMNNVCAAGTGSFVEEQARKLGVDIGAYADLASGVRAPRVSDRCTVFMERDINHLLATGCSVEEVLAAALHAVRENYLRKVAAGKAIGKVVFFQGATAKNRALVAAFEQKLGRPILVSAYCHLTGAYGAALTLLDQGIQTTTFRGLGLCHTPIPVRTETCELCGNHCKLSVAKAGGEEVAFGFLCGREYGTKAYVAKKHSVPSLDSIRAKAESDALAAIGLESRDRAATRSAPESGNHSIGLPAALSLAGELDFWQLFFSTLGIRTIVSSTDGTAVANGKNHMGAEFCAPIAALHGHALSLMESADFIFLPRYLEKKQDHEEGKQQYCYNTQFSSALVSQLGEADRFLMPLVEVGYTSFHVTNELHRCLTEKGKFKVTYKNINDAWDLAQRFRTMKDQQLKEAFRTEHGKTGRDIGIVLLGRPYSVLMPDMNKGIPDLINDRGVRAWYQDMLEETPDSLSEILPMIRELPWGYGKQILKAAETTARTDGLYPVFITSFKCGPDSFVLDAFKSLMDAYGKPYLILELDDHDSSLGYGTRIEAAVRSFRNHWQEAARTKNPEAGHNFSAANPHYRTELKGKTLLLPNWDELAAPLLAASLRAAGVHAVVMEETDATIRASLSTNSGQCLPLNAIVESFVHTVRKEGLDPADCAIWMARSAFSCNIPLYPHQMKFILDGMGGGFEKAMVYVGELSFLEISPLAAIDAYQSYLFAGLIRRLACRIRPYEKVKGMTDACVSRAMQILVPAFEDRRRNKVKAAEEIIASFEAIPYDRSYRNALVALFGDFYVRDNSVMNQKVIQYIEENGGEVVSMPYNQYAKMIADSYFSRWMKEGRYGARFRFGALLAASRIMEKAYYRIFDRVLEQTDPEFNDSSEEILSRYGVILENSGESSENLLKTWYIKKHFPEVSLFVQLSPVFCCAGLVTEAMNRRIEEITGVPVVSLTYDGTGSSCNAALAPYLRYPRRPKPASELDISDASKQTG
ncbi:MAG: acyl-CoA dehydratase activase [Clostridia bacterium]|jgi:predicted CoA-substrate-specific enzyme activase